MGLSGKLEIELEIKSPAAKFFDLFAKQLHDVQNITGSIHGAELHEGDHWHNMRSVKHWTYTIDGKVVRCKERIEAFDEENKSMTFDLFEGDIMEHYKSFKMSLKVYEKDDGGAIAKWTMDYEKLNEGIPPPNGYLDYVTNVTKDADAHILKA